MLDEYSYLAIPFCLILALVAPLYLLPLADLPLLTLAKPQSVGGVWLSTTDVVLAALVLGMLLRSRRGLLRRIREIPHLWLWLLLGVFLSVSYLAVPENQADLDAPQRTAYQLYRYCWRLIVYYPIAMLLLTETKKIRQVMFAIVVAGDLAAIQAIIEALDSAYRPQGPFSGPNELAGALAVPFLFALVGLLYPQSRWQRLFCGLSILLIIRASLFAGSRGAWIATLGGTAFFILALVVMRRERARVLRFAALGIVALTLILIVKPDLMQRPTIRRMSTIRTATSEGTFVWRYTLRWPHFWGIAVENPWLGTGKGYDPSLGRAAHSTHNGYLYLAVKYGFPVAVSYVLFAVLGLRGAVRLFRRSDAREDRVMAAALAASLAAILVHNLAETTILVSLVERTFWLIIALSVAAGLRVRQLQHQQEDLPEPAGLGAPSTESALRGLQP